MKVRCKGRLSLYVGFHLVGMVGYALVAEEPASVGCDEDIVLDADAAEVAVFVNSVEVEEAG